MPEPTALAQVLPTLGQLHSLGPSWLNPDHLIATFGAYALIGVCVIVFIETGLLFPLLPGDSLLFTAGALVAQGTLHFPLWLLCGLLFAAAFLGDQTAYWIGRRMGPRIFNRPDSRIFKQSHITETNAYFERYGGRTVIIARFVPFVRTYSAVAAGVGKMRYPHFAAFDAVGALLWGVGVTLLGFALGRVTEKPRSAWRYGMLLWLGVERKFKRSGIATRLLRQLTGRFIENDVRLMLVDTAAKNQAALAFFRRSGFGQEIRHVYLSQNLENDPRYIQRNDRSEDDTEE